MESVLQSPQAKYVSALLVHAEVTAAMLDHRVGLFEAPRIHEELHPLVRGELACLVLALDPCLAAALPGFLEAPPQFFQSIHFSTYPSSCTPSDQPFGTFSQSARNFSRPMSVSGCLSRPLMTLSGIVATSAPISADCTACIG